MYNFCRGKGKDGLNSSQSIWLKMRKSIALELLKAFG